MHFLKIILSAIFIIFIASCHDSQKKNNTVNFLTTYNLPPYFEKINKKFHLEYDDIGKLDSTNFMFYSSKHFDTSFLLQLKRASNSIFGVCYLIPPQIGGNGSYLDDKFELTYFNGFSFIINLATWQKIIDKANKEIFSKSTAPSPPKCCDQPYYMLVYNLNSSSINEENKSNFENFEGFLKQTLLDTLYLKINVRLKSPIKVY